VHFEAALNLVWLALGLAALAMAGRNVLKRRRVLDGSGLSHGAPAWLHIVGVALIVVALFPYISATDDLLRIEHFHARADQQHTNLPGKHSRTDNLIRLYETMDTPLVCAVREISLVFFFIALVFLPVLRLVERCQPQESGRSPPILAL
jgi:hypothetical protein